MRSLDGAEAGKEPDPEAGKAAEELERFFAECETEEPTEAALKAAATVLSCPSEAPGPAAPGKPTGVARSRRGDSSDPGPQLSDRFCHHVSVGSLGTEVQRGHEKPHGGAAGEGPRGPCVDHPQDSVEDPVRDRGGQLLH